MFMFESYIVLRLNAEIPELGEHNDHSEFEYFGHRWKSQGANENS